MLAEQGAAGNGKVSARVRVANTFRIRGMVGMVDDDSSATTCDAELKVDGVSKLILSFVGRPDVANYMLVNGTAGIEVPPDTEVSITTHAAGGTCTGMFVALDTVP